MTTTGQKGWAQGFSNKTAKEIRKLSFENQESWRTDLSSSNSELLAVLEKIDVFENNNFKN